MNKNSTENNNPAEIKASGLKATQPRLKILEIFQQNPVRHLSAEDIYRQLMTDNLQIGLATVYRVLAQFEQAGLLTRNFFETGKAVYELNEGLHHDHIICMNCGKVEEFHDDRIEAWQHEIAQARGFELVGHTLALYGYCIPVCEKQE